jgi:hypothetical protein
VNTPGTLSLPDIVQFIHLRPVRVEALKGLSVSNPIILSSSVPLGFVAVELYRGRPRVGDSGLVVFNCLHVLLDLPSELNLNASRCILPSAQSVLIASSKHIATHI